MDAELTPEQLLEKEIAELKARVEAGEGRV